MSVVGAPVPLTPGQSVTVKSGMPAPGLGSVLGVVLQNLSSYLLTVVIGGNAYSLAPWTADAFALDSSGSPVTVTPATVGTTDPAGVATVCPTWLTSAQDADELAGAYPATLPISPATTSSLSASAAQIAAALAGNGSLNAAGIAAALATNNNLTAGGVAAALAAGGVPINQSSAVLINRPNGVLTSADYLNVSGYQSLSFYLTPVGGAYGDIINLVITFYDRDSRLAGANKLGVHVVTAAQQWAGGPDAPEVSVRVPVSGPWVQVDTFQVPSSAGVRIGMSCVGLTQPCTEPRVTYLGSPADGAGPNPICLYDSSPTNAYSTLAAGASKSYYLPPCSGNVKLMFTGTGFASNNYNVTLLGLGGRNDGTFRRLNPTLYNVINTGPNHGDQILDIAVPWGQAMRLDLQNTDTVSRGPFLSVYDTSPR